MKILDLLPKVTAQAHCDVPCGIYDPTAAKVAAKTVAKMVQQLNELDKPNDNKDAWHAHHNSLTRRIAVKEEHAELCKKELLVLWTDFFKPEHLEKVPKLHDMFWKATKLCSKNKQKINADAAKELVKAVDEIAKIFYEVKNVPDRYKAYQEITDKLY